MPKDIGGLSTKSAAKPFFQERSPLELNAKDPLQLQARKTSRSEGVWGRWQDSGACHMFVLSRDQVPRRVMESMEDEDIQGTLL